MSDQYSLSAKRVAYFMTFLNLMGGLINLIMGIYRIDSLQIAGGVISLLAGAILLIGIIKDKAKFVLVYLIIETVMFALGTICGLLLMIVLVTVSAQIMDGPREVHIGKDIIIDKYLAGVIAFIALVIIILSWIVHFLMYIFYDDMATRKLEASQRAESTVVAYNTMAETSDGTSACRVRFVDDTNL